MKAFTLALACAAIVILSVPSAYAKDGTFERLLKTTQEDYNAVRSAFRETRESETSWAAYQRTAGVIFHRIAIRRKALAYMAELSRKTLPMDQQGLALMYLADLENINLSLMALIKDGRGYAGYMKTGDGELVKGISNWEDGIRLALKETGRSIRLGASITGPLVLRAGLKPLPAH